MIPWIGSLYETRVKAKPGADEEGEPCVVVMIEGVDAKTHSVWLDKARYDAFIIQVLSAKNIIEGDKSLKKKGLK